MQESMNYDNLDQLPSEATFPQIQATLTPILEAILAIQDKTAQQKACTELRGTIERVLKDSMVILIVRNCYFDEAPNCDNAIQGRVLLKRKMLNAREITDFLDRLRTPPEAPSAPQAEASVQGIIKAMMKRLRGWLQR